MAMAALTGHRQSVRRHAHRNASRGGRRLRQAGFAGAGAGRQRNAGFGVAADFNGDGKIDLAAVGSSSGLVYMLPGNGDGTFRTAVTYPPSPGANFLLAADVNGDGNPDLLVANQVPRGVSGSVSVLLGNGDGTFHPAVNYAAGSRPVRLAAADFNRDGNSTWR